VSLYYERRGAGSPLVLLHGIGHHWQAWIPVLDRLAARHTVYAVDLPGFGSSPLPEAGLPDGMASAVAGLREAFLEWGLDRPHVAGNSLGGALALELAVAGAAASATAFSPAGFARPWEAHLALANLRSLRLGTRLPEPLMRRILSTRAGRVAGYGMLLGHPTRIPAEQALVDALALRRGSGFNPVARHARRYAFAGPVAVPVTVAWGTRDRILLPRQARRARALLPQARHVSLPGAGHVPMFDEPELVAELILSTAAAA
jgi:pimeloyl-ACP methyl ester carboxylesterase